jgi:hypothetical protein
MDPVTVSVIATTTVGVLSSFLAKAMEAAASKVGGDLYQILKDRLSKKPAAQEALADLEKVPEDTDRQAALRVQLKKLMTEDESLARQLEQLLKNAAGTEAGATVIKQVAGDNAKQFGQVFGNITFR